MNKNILEKNNQNNRGEKNSPLKKINLYKKNTINSLHDVEYFLNNFQHYFKYFKLYKIMKK